MTHSALIKIFVILCLGSTIAVVQKIYFGPKVANHILTYTPVESKKLGTQKFNKTNQGNVAPGKNLKIKSERFTESGSSTEKKLNVIEEESSSSDFEKSNSVDVPEKEKAAIQNNYALTRTEIAERAGVSLEKTDQISAETTSSTPLIASARSSVRAPAGTGNVARGSPSGPTTSSNTSSAGGNTPNVTGVVYPLKVMTLVRSNNERLLPQIKNFIVSDAYAASCSAVASLYELDPVTSLPATSPKNSVVVKPDATFYFNPSTLNLDLNTPNKYLIKVTGCNGDYQRIVTDYYSNQDVSIGTTLLAKVIEVPTAKKVIDADHAQLQQITYYVDPNATTLESAYSKLTKNTRAPELFSTIFGNTITTLTNSKPHVINESISLVVNEKSNTTYSITVDHWFSQYDVVQEWYFDNSFVTTGASYVYSPSANDQGGHVLKTRIGKNDGTNHVNTTLPYNEKTWNITVLDTYPSVAPAFYLNAANPSPVLADSFDIDINTGAGKINCENFSTFAITETAMTPPESEFIYSCTTAGTQTQNISLTQQNDGQKTLYLWTRDSRNNISQSPSTLSYRKDTSNPTVAFSNIVGTIQGGSPYILNFSANDNNEITSIIVKLSSDNGASYSTVATLPAGSTTYSWNVPSLETLANFVKITAVDGAGKTIDSVMSKFVISTTSPTAPVYALVSPAITNNATVALTITSCSNTTHILLNSGKSPAANDAGWVACSTAAGNYTYTLSAPDGNKSFAIWAKDATEDISASSTVNILLDTTAPVASLGDLPAIVKGTDSYGLTFSSSDNVSIQSTKLFYSIDGSTYNLIANNPVSPYTWTIPVADTSGARLKFVVTDTAGNITNVMNSSFVIDSTPPSPHSVALASSSPSNTTAVTLTASSCADTPYVLVNEGSAPASNSGSWQGCSTAAGAISYSVAAIEETHNLKVWYKDSVGNVTTSSSNAEMIYDITPPAVSFGTVAAALKGGNNESITFTSTDANGVQLTKFQFAADGITFSDVTANPVSPYSWTVPSTNTSTSKLRIVANDVAGNTKSVESNSFSIDSTPPAAPALALVSEILTNSLINTFTASTCSDTPSLLFNEGIKPASSDIAWRSCSTTASALSYTIAGGEGAHTIKVWSKDAVGNVSATSTDFAITYDITNPSQTLNNLAAILKGGTNANITFTQSDTYGISSSKLQYSSDGTTFSDVVANPVSPYSWTVPTHNTSSAKIKLITADNAGNTTSVLTTAFTIDSTPPSAPVANLYSPAISSSTNVAVTIADCFDRPQIMITENMIAPGAADVGWTACSTVAGAHGTVLIGPVIQGMHTVYVWAKDAAGNVSSSTVLTMSYDTVAPTVNLATTLSGSYKGGVVLPLSLSATDASGVSGFKIEYAADGATFTTVANLAAGATSYNWTIPTDNTTTAKIRISANDIATATNTALVLSGSFTIDSTAPTAQTIALASNYYSSSTSITLTASNCTDRTHVLVNEGVMPASGDAGWQACTTAAAGITYTIAATQGTHTLKVWAKDAVGNVSSPTNVLMVYDSIAPIINITNSNNAKGNQTIPVKFTVTEENSSAAQNILVEYYDGTLWTNKIVASQNGPLVSTIFSTTVVTPNSENTTVIIKVSFTDLAGNSTQSSVTFKTDLNPPLVDSLSVNGGSLSTTNNNVQIALSAHDTISKVTQFCLKYNDSAVPDVNASCWKDVNAPTPGIVANATISFTGYFYQIGFAMGNYLIYAWAKDESGQISTNSSTINVDAFNIAFDSGTSPVVSKVQVTNSDAPGTPVTAADLSAPSGGDIYIKWNASDLEGLAANPISIKYSIDDSTFFDLAGGSNILNGVNGSCTIDVGYTGCAVLSAPSSNYFKIRLIAKDMQGTTVFFNSAPLNENRFRILAGNTEHGLNGSARSAVFYAYGMAAVGYYGFKNKLVVSDDGKFIYLDPVRGLLWIEPTTGNLKTFIATSGSISGDGGVIANATLASPLAIALDHTNQLLIWDSNRIRRVNLDTMIISTLVGGGAQTDPLVTVNSSNMNLGYFNDSSGTLIPLPNGDIIFTAPSGSLHHRRYRAIDQKIELIETTGVGITSYPADIWTDKSKLDLGVAYNTTTSALTFMAQGFLKIWVGDAYPLHSRIDISSGNETTPYSGMAPYDLPFNVSHMYSGLDGKLYTVPRFRASLNRYDPATNTLTTILGTGSYGTSPCADNTMATACAIDLDSFFISKSGRVYFIDNGVLRTIDDNNKVITLFGQYSSYGNNVAATAARFGGIADINLGKATDGNKVIVEDSFSSTFREFAIGGNLINLAPAYYTWHGPYGFEVDQSTGDILAPVGPNIIKFDRATGTYSNVVGGGTYTYYDSAADGKTGPEINLISDYSLTTLGLLNNKLYYSKNYWTGSGHAGCALKSYDITDSYRQAHVSGDASSTCSTNLAVGNNFSSSSIWAWNDLMKLHSFADPVDGQTKLFVARTNTNVIYKSLNGGAIENFVTLAHYTSAFTYNTNASGLNLYYCASNGFLYKYNYNSGSTTQLSWSSPTVRCTGAKSILYHSGRNSLILVFSQNGLTGIGEYDLN